MEPLNRSPLRARQQFPRKERCPMCQAVYQYERAFQKKKPDHATRVIAG